MKSTIKICSIITALAIIFSLQSIAQWSLTGNAGTNPSTNFIGTVDNVDLSLRRNNQRVAWFGSLNTSLGQLSLASSSTGTYNIALGIASLYSNTTGYNNSSTGGYSLNKNTTGYDNVANGVYALHSNTSGKQNVGIGNKALYNNVTGNNNTAIGYNANVGVDGLTNATAIGNGAVVNQSNAIQLGNSTITKVYAGTGTNATLVAGGLQVTGGTPAIGKVLVSDVNGVATWQDMSAGNDNQTLSLNGNQLTISNGNTVTLPTSGGVNGWSLTGNAGTDPNTNFIGTMDSVPFNIRVNNQPAGRISPSNQNTSYGYQTLVNTTGGGNTANGFVALKNNINGSYNTAIGSAALFTNTSGEKNTATGVLALHANNGENNTANGVNALQFNSTGNSNTGIGFNALQWNFDGNYNVAMGVGALLRNSSGNQNVAMGFGALQTNLSGNNNAALGYEANVATNNLINATAIGANAVVNASNKIRLGDASVTMIEGNPPMYTGSDGRFKTNIAENEVKGLEFIKKLRPVVYNFDTKKFTEFLTKNMSEEMRKQYLDKDFTASTAIRQSGFIAQEVEQAAKEVGYNFNGVHVPENENDNYSIAYSQFVVPLVKAVQELSKKNERLEAALRKAGIAIEEATESVNQSQTETKLQKTTSVVPKEFGVSSSPNPFNPIAKIKVSLPQDAKLNVAVYDVSGRLVSTLSDNEQKSAGIYNYEFNGSSVASGSYFVQVQAGEFTSTQKIMLVK